MSRLVIAFAFLMLLSPTTRLLGIEVCLVNDSNRTAIITVISGAEHLEKRLIPKSHVFVSLVDNNNDRVVIAQTVDESNADQSTWSFKVVDTKVLTDNVDRLNFCYVHEAEPNELKMDLLAFVCMDIVPQTWGKEPSNERFADVKSSLVKSLKTTKEIGPESQAKLKRFVHQFSLHDQEQPSSR